MERPWVERESAIEGGAAVWERGGVQPARTLFPDGKCLSQEKGQKIGKIKHKTRRRVRKSS